MTYLWSRQQQAPWQRQHILSTTRQALQKVCSGPWWEGMVHCTSKERVYYSTSKIWSMQPGSCPLSRIYILRETNYILCHFGCASNSEMHCRRLYIFNWILHWIANGPLDFINYYFQVVLNNRASPIPYNNANHYHTHKKKSPHLCQKVIVRNLALFQKTLGYLQVCVPHTYSATPGIALLCQGCLSPPWSWVWLILWKPNKQNEKSRKTLPQTCSLS